MESQQRLGEKNVESQQRLGGEFTYCKNLLTVDKPAMLMQENIYRWRKNPRFACVRALPLDITASHLRFTFF